MHKKPLSALNYQNRKRFSNVFRLLDSSSNKIPFLKQSIVTQIEEKVLLFRETSRKA